MKMKTADEILNQYPNAPYHHNFILLAMEEYKNQFSGSDPEGKEAVELKAEIKKRIIELNNADAELCKDRWNMELPEIQRRMAREESNKMTFARQELEQLLKKLNSDKNVHEGDATGLNPS
jgi:DNA polymerase III sliding clamp (beta) subunit (PCNA family)